MDILFQHKRVVVRIAGVAAKRLTNESPQPVRARDCRTLRCRGVGSGASLPYPQDSAVVADHGWVHVALFKLPERLFEAAFAERVACGVRNVGGKPGCLLDPHEVSHSLAAGVLVTGHHDQVQARSVLQDIAILQHNGVSPSRFTVQRWLELPGAGKMR
jgi:hypothetical protein